ncbi:unnamed protein product [Phaeothamnion confervicola]
MMRELAPQSSDGGYVRPTYGFRGTIGSPEFPADSGRYHVYLGNACPWCHRVALALVLLGIGGSVSSSRMLDDPERASRGGWAFGPGGFEDPVFGCSDLRAVYDLCQPGYQGRCTAPLLVDRKTRSISQSSRDSDFLRCCVAIGTTGKSLKNVSQCLRCCSSNFNAVWTQLERSKRRRIVNNESSDIIRHLNAAVVALLSGSGSGSEGTLGGVVELRPVALAEEIDRINEMTYTKLNNAVYRCGFATSQKAYEAALADVVEGLERCDELLSKRRFLAGDVFTEADLRLFPTIIRFDVVYATLFKCQRRRVVDSPNVSAWMRDVYQLPGVAATIDVGDAIRSYYTNLFPLNPGGIVPLGPDAEDLELEREANRGSRDHEAVFVSRAFPVQSNGHLIL